jgi:hypothetical protein
MKADISLLLLLIFSSALSAGASGESGIFGDSNFSEVSEVSAVPEGLFQDNRSQDLPDRQSIEFKGCGELLLPQVKNSGRENVSILSLLPIFLANQSITWTAVMPDNSSNSTAFLCISPFSVSDFLSVLDGSGNYSRDNCLDGISSGQLSANGSGLAEFRFPPAESGMYAVYIAAPESAGKNGSDMGARPLLVTETDLELIMPDRILPDEQFISIELNTTVLDNESKFFAAVMMLESDYRNASLTLSENGSSECTDMTLTLSGQSMSIPCPFRLSAGLLFSMLPLLPENSAVGLQESSLPGAGLTLMSENPWKSGRYMVTCCAYSRERGLLGAEQRTVEVI